MLSSSVALPGNRPLARDYVVVITSNDEDDREEDEEVAQLGELHPLTEVRLSRLTGFSRLVEKAEPFWRPTNAEMVVLRCHTKAVSCQHVSDPHGSLSTP